MKENEITVGVEKEVKAKAQRKRRKEKLDRSGFRYSESVFLGLPRKEQIKLANTYLQETRAEAFDDAQMFQFSRTHFADICKRIGIVQGYVDVKSTSETRDLTIYITYGSRQDPVEIKLTVEREVKEMFDELLSDCERLSNLEISKLKETILKKALEVCLDYKKKGALHFKYRPMEEKELL
ncbi:MAG: hypothetical protein K6E50_00060 [Lachnospiraceae bacterium]|nr:hypothetical protein [Lachnospiraceae bacterium]